MEALAALHRQLDFIHTFYLTAAPAFEALLKKRNPANASESLKTFYDEKWSETFKGLETIGQCSLSLVSKAL